MSKRQLRPGTFAFAPTALCLDPRLGKPALRVGMLLAARANAARECWLSTDTMATLLQTSRSSVIAGLAELGKYGHVLRARRSSPGRGQSSSVYTLLFRDPAELEFLPQDVMAAASEETADPEQNGPGGEICQSASLDLPSRSRSEPDRKRRSG